ncbi:class I SAM-dependent methyltransferase [Salinimicrobium sediminilitoris]|uniref:class I SAM-dependent methyltransferase n=1 Tax=Salinimicrobium sediminilitoris TaxID=2876715 RepID=UPI001E3CD2B2|nr:methyltransferase domain-containing protein [Salinimicrobium sediminilitoris]MCC8358525.1 methyltransferase domain-containing protein [Salinimicrobium sediminilitoris]
MKLRYRLKNFLKKSPYQLYEILRNSRQRRIDSIKDEQITQNYFDNNKIYKLQIGCGENLHNGWLNSDLKPSEKAIKLDAGKEFPFNDDTFHYIYSEHLFEHLNLSEQKTMLEEAFRILKKGGILRIATPSIDFLFDLYDNPEEHINQKYSKWAVDMLPGLKDVRTRGVDSRFYHIYVINHFFKAWGHQTIHNFESLSNLGDSAGFSKIKKTSVGESEDPILRDVERHGYIIPQEINFHETMVIELTK